jgi:type III secretion system YscQ/HrcQ family protein
MKAVPWLPPTLLRMSHEAELWNAILSYAGRPLRLGTGKATVQFAAADRPDPTTPALLVQPTGGARFVAILRSFPFKAMFGADFEAADVDRLPASLRDCLNEGVVATLWSAIPDNRMGDCTITATGPLGEIVEEAIPGAPQWLSVTLQGVTPEPAAVLLGLSVGAWVDAIAGGSLAPAQVANGLKAQIQTQAWFTLGSMELTLDAVARLAPGDVVVLPEQPSDLVLVRAEWTCYSFRRADKGWSCVGRDAFERYRAVSGVAEGMTAMSKDTERADGPAPGAAASGIGTLAVVIDFDIGRTSVPLAELQTWQPGTVVALDPPTSAEGVEVTVRANGQAVAIGDLVRIDDRVAVRISRLLFGN